MQAMQPRGQLSPSLERTKSDGGDLQGMRVPGVGDSEMTGYAKVSIKPGGVLPCQGCCNA